MLKKFVLFAVIPLIVSGCKPKESGVWNPGKPLDKSEVKIAVVYLDDAKSGYSLAHLNGITEAKNALGLSEDQIINKFNINESDPIMAEAAISEAIAEGANIVVATSYGFMDVCEKLAERYPNVVFAHASGYKSNDTNFTNYFGRVYQTRYLSGIAAGLRTESGKIGYVAAQDSSNSEVTGGVDAFALGVESVNPNAKVYVKITHSWYDPQGEKQAADKLIEEGCDVIAQHCDTENPQIEAEKAGVWGIGYNTDMSKEAPNAVLTSVIWNWGVYYEFLFKSVIDGSFTTEPYFGGLKQGFVGITPLNETLTAPGTKEAVEAAEARITDGSFNVFDGVLETNDGAKVGSEGGTLSDSEITGNIHWYYRNIILL